MQFKIEMDRNGKKKTLKNEERKNKNIEIIQNTRKKHLKVVIPCLLGYFNIHDNWQQNTEKKIQK